MRLAYSISGYKDPAQFAWLIGAIADARDVFVIHVDAKSPPAIHQGFKDAAANCPNVHFIEPEPVIWMGKGLVQAEFRAMAKIFQAAPDFDYLINLSAQDYPLTCRQERVARLAATPGFNHLALKPLDDLPFHIRRRRFLFSFEWRNRLIKTPLPRLIPADLDIAWKGSWWRVLTREVCGWLLTTAKREAYWRFLRQVQIPDELIMQNLIMDSPYRDSVTGDNQHLILWPGRTGNPKTLRMIDLPAIEASPKLFTRKLDHHVDRGLLEHLAKRINAPIPSHDNVRPQEQYAYHGVTV